MFSRMADEQGSGVPIYQSFSNHSYSFLQDFINLDVPHLPYGLVIRSCVTPKCC